MGGVIFTAAAPMRRSSAKLVKATRVASKMRPVVFRLVRFYVFDRTYKYIERNQPGDAVVSLV